MKKILIITGGITMGIMLLTSCDRTRRSPGRAYMPDMAYSNAYETYSPAQERLAASGAHYNSMPVEGTIARGELAAYRLKNDTAGYSQSAAIKNPLDVAAINIKEAERLYLINCAICHGAKLDGNGPLYNGGNGPFAAAPKNFLADDMKKMTEGTMYHSVTYGKGQMGSYASQLTSQQRWMVIAYVKSKQSAGAAAVADSAGAAAPKADSTAAPKVDSIAVPK